MSTSSGNKGKGRSELSDPLAEDLGGSKNLGASTQKQYDDEEDDEDLIVHSRQEPLPGQSDEDEDELQGTADEQENLLGRRDGGFRSMIFDNVDENKRRKGWIRIFGIPLPRPLLYLLSIPPLLLLLSTIFPSSSPLIHRIPTLSNGTHPFHPTVILISLDGFRPKYLETHKDLLPNLLSISEAANERGLRAISMKPVFPTLTFPNHWSLMTGLHPESHGIIANNFYDPLFPAPTSAGNEEEGGGGGKEVGAQFMYTEESKSWDSNWWWGEPIWSVVERMGRKSAVIMWPGPPVTSAGISPSYFVPYRKLSPSEKVNQIFSYLDNHPIETRPEFIASYFPEIDQSGHRGGPNSKGVNDSLKMCDEMLGDLFHGLKERGLEAVVDVIIVSDHGMAETSNDRIIYLDDILGEAGVNAIEHQDGWPSVGLRFKDDTDTEYYLKILLDAADASNGTFAVYTHDTMPERWHFNHGHRIAPIYVVPTIGWAITDHHEHEVLFQGDYKPKGNHGYDNLFPEMQAIFFAQGPFVKRLKENASPDVYEVQDPPILKSFRNLEVFSLVTRLLGLSDIEPPHNGTIGFWDDYLGPE